MTADRHDSSANAVAPLVARFTNVLHAMQTHGFDWACLVCLICGCTQQPRHSPADNRTGTGGGAGDVSGDSAGGTSGTSSLTGGRGGGSGGDVSVDAGSAAGGVPNDAGAWKLIWHDEFDDAGPPDSAKWTYVIKPPRWVNQELQNYTARPENVRIENGVLVIEARQDFYDGHQYSSGRLVNATKGDLLYGRIEVKAKLPKGRGTWPAIWMYPTDSRYGGWPDSGELDIMEHVGFDPGVVHASIHCRNYQWKNNTQKTATTMVADFGDTFHVYAAEWAANRIDVFVDDQKFFSFENQGTGWESWPFDQRFHLILNVAIGGVWGGAQGIDNSIFPQRMEVDYVRLYQPGP